MKFPELSEQKFDELCLPRENIHKNMGNGW